MAKVQVLLATYNGERYIKEQIESILNQSYRELEILIRDDGSTDNTVKVIEAINDDRIILIQDQIKCGSPGLNFKRLLEVSEADYILFSDQDDVWLEDKVAMTIDSLSKIEGPGLVYSDGIVVDEFGASIGLFTAEKSKKIKNLSDLIFFNGGFQGCSIGINKELKIKISFEKNYWYMHDQVVSFYAMCFGKIVYIDKPLFLYRQHGRNVLGHSHNISFSELLSFRGRRVLIHDESKKFIYKFIANEKNNLSHCDLSTLNNFEKYLKSSWLGTFYCILTSNLTIYNSSVKLLIKNIIYKRS